MITRMRALAGATACLAVVVCVPGAVVPRAQSRTGPLGQHIPLAQLPADRSRQEGLRRDWPERLAAWTAAVRGHEVGAFDVHVRTVAGLPRRELLALSEDLGALRDLVARLHRQRAGGRAAEWQITYGRRTMAVSEVQRLLGMARDKEAATGDMNPLVKRGAALHADVVFFAPPELSATSLSAASSILIQDGRQIGFDNSGIHWEFARALLDLAHPSPASDAEVRRWYAATGALMRRQLSHAHSGPHLERAIALFPGDPDFQFLAGCLHEALASLRIQSFLRSSGRRPPGVSSSANELATAERSFSRAVELAPAWAEARLRLGRVLDLRERHEDAIGELTRALHDADEPTLRYFGGLFLGDAEQALGRREPAQAAYEQALALFPGAQSPHLALAQLARRFADRPAALAAIDRLFSRPVQSYQSFDPWWHYDAGTVGSDEEVHRAVVDAFAGERRP